MAATATETLELSAAFWKNDRSAAVFEGRIVPEGITLYMSSIYPSEIFWRQLKFADFDFSEMSMSSLLISTAQGQKDWVALPIFTMRSFFHTWSIVRASAGIEKPQDLRGKRVGVPEYQQTAAVWSRGILQHEFGVEPREIEWFMERSPEMSHGGSTGFTPPPGVKLSYIPPTTDIAQMLLAGELDASLLYINTGNLVDRAKADLSATDEIRPLYDPLVEGARFYKKTGLYPINHCAVVRRSIYEKHPWIARSLYDAFLAARIESDRRRIGSLDNHIATGLVDRSVKAELEHDLFAYGIKGAGKVLETIATYLHEQGLTKRVVALDEVFARECMDV
jgi:4,5-dihydroxyphthalate decarboxylase